MTRALASLCFALLLRCFALLCFALLPFADHDDGGDELRIMILTIVRIVTIVSTLSIVTIISMSPIRLCLRGPREPSEALGRPRGLLAFALLCLAHLCLPLLCFALLGFALLGFNLARLCFAFPLLRLALLC